MAQKSQLISDIKELSQLLKRLNDDVSQEFSAAGIGPTATKIRDAASKLKEKMEVLIRLKLMGEDVTPPPDVGS